MSVTQASGPILEETHYYPFGLVMAGISTTAPLKLANNYKYNGKLLNHNEFSDGTGLEWYSYGFRDYDAQIGRFIEQYPLTDGLATVSPYQYALNDPAANIDANGLLPANLLCPGAPSLVVFLTKAVDVVSRFGGTPLAHALSLSVHAAGTGANIGQMLSVNATINNLAATKGVGMMSHPGGPRQEHWYRNSETGQIVLMEGSKEYRGYTRLDEWEDDNFPGDYKSDQQSKKYGGVVYVHRTWETSKSTISTFTTKDESVRGFILEPAGPSTNEANQDKRIPPGIYLLTSHVNKRLKSQWQLYNEKVPKSRYILIHIGNFPSNTEGCLLPGRTRSVDYVGQSGPMLKRLNDYINSFNGDVQIIIYDPPNP